MMNRGRWICIRWIKYVSVKRLLCCAFAAIVCLCFLTVRHCGESQRCTETLKQVSCHENDAQDASALIKQALDLSDSPRIQLLLREALEDAETDGEATKGLRRRRFPEKSYEDHTVLDGQANELELRQIQQYSPTQTTPGEQRPLSKSVQTGKPEVCPEIKLENDIYYEEGWVIQTCDDARKLENMVTILINAVQNTPSEIRSLVRQIRDRYTDVRIIMSVTSQSQYLPLKLRRRCSFIVSKQGSRWRRLVSTASTKYVLLLPNVHRFSQYTNVERLLSFASRFGASAVGGASVGSNGHWWHGCHEVSLRNYHLQYHYGYSKSLDSCMYCDHIEGPFLAIKRELVQGFGGLNHDSLFFERLFLNRKINKQQNVVCPDSMFHVKQIGGERKQFKSEWRIVAKQFRLNEIHTFSGNSFKYSCDETKITCPDFWDSTGLLQPPCCLEKIRTCNQILIELAGNAGVPVELTDGSLLCALKFKSECPWDLDTDLHFDNVYTVDRVAKIVNSSSVWRKNGCVLRLTTNRNYDNNKELEIRLAGVRYSIWHTDVYNSSWVAGSRYLQQYKYNYTRVMYGGKWVPAPPSPGLFVRNKYVNEIYKHAVHHLHSNTDQSSAYDPSKQKFPKCKHPGKHFCLDQFTEDGNLQFN